MSMADFEELIQMELKSAEQLLKTEHRVLACVTYVESFEDEEEEARIMELAITETVNREALK